MSAKQVRLPGQEPKYLALVNIIAVLALLAAFFSVICRVANIIFLYWYRPDTILSIQIQSVCKNLLILYLPLIACIGGFCKIRKHNILMVGITAVLLMVQLLGGVLYQLLYQSDGEFANAITAFLNMVPGSTWLAALLGSVRFISRGFDLSKGRSLIIFLQNLTALLYPLFAMGSTALCLVFFSASLRKETLASSKVPVLAKLLGIAAVLLALFIPLYELAVYMFQGYPLVIMRQIFQGSLPQHILLLVIALTALVGSLLNIRRHSIPMSVLTGGLLLLQLVGNVGYFVLWLTTHDGQIFTWIPGATLLYQCLFPILFGRFSLPGLLFALGNALIILCSILCFATFALSFESKKKAAALQAAKEAAAAEEAAAVEEAAAAQAPVETVSVVEEIPAVDTPAAQEPVCVVETPVEIPPIVEQPAPAPATGSTADELGKFKALLDAGAITQEEYDAVKKRLLGL